MIKYLVVPKNDTNGRLSESLNEDDLRLKKQDKVKLFKIEGDNFLIEEIDEDGETDEVPCFYKGR